MIRDAILPLSCQVSSCYCPIILYSRLLPFLDLKDERDSLNKDRHRRHRPRTVPDAQPRICIVPRRSDSLIMSSTSFSQSTLPRSQRPCQRTRLNIVRKAMSDGVELYRHSFLGDLSMQPTEVSYTIVVHVSIGTTNKLVLLPVLSFPFLSLLLSLANSDPIDPSKSFSIVVLLTRLSALAAFSLGFLLGHFVLGFFYSPPNMANPLLSTITKCRQTLRSIRRSRSM